MRPVHCINIWKFVAMRGSLHIIYPDLIIIITWNPNLCQFALNSPGLETFYFQCVCPIMSIFNNKRQIKVIFFVTLEEATHNTGVYKVYNQVYFHLYPRSVHILRSISHEHYTIAMSEEWNIFWALSSSCWMALS